jgi:hypothetical protein
MEPPFLSFCIFAKLPKKKSKNQNSYSFFYASGKVKDEPMGIRSAKSLSATNHNRWKRNQKTLAMNKVGIPSWKQEGNT